ncbi:transcription elongation factor GreA domain protein [Neorickettsia helminthoeca str. Oregon]|uniref:Transcription elongation factor GreA n=1 Tax=Neorickettsia helminthoeca str. Oregon TaxID=1286528 RepID=X5H4G6_9RICK|nr:transcription elongation factor GreA [Neorickettsia helminthoeca]AHX11568.1 transcription elongation factor GreA domain protein [Neorickettsia helminthoeca str. Oregon]
MEKLPITREGYVRLKDELEHLVKVVKPSIIAAVAQARELGDLSENAEYHEARKEQSFVEGKILELESQLAKAEIIDVSQLSGDKVKFGASVTVENLENGTSTTYQIVGNVESNIKERKISLSSPIGKAIMNKEAGDVVEIELPNGQKIYKILKVEFK